MEELSGEADLSAFSTPIWDFPLLSSWVRIGTWTQTNLSISGLWSDLLAFAGFRRESQKNNDELFPLEEQEFF